MIEILKSIYDTKVIEMLKDIATIVFSIVGAIVAVLSYIQAKKTLFAPIRTETFKLQLKAFEEVLLYFQNKSEAEFLDSFDLNTIVSLNTLQMSEEYVSAFFSAEIKIDAEERAREYSVLVGGYVSQGHMQKYFEEIEPTGAQVFSSSEAEPITNPANVLARWLEYEHGMVMYTQKYLDQLKDLEKLAASPLLPKSLRDMIMSFNGKAKENILMVGEVVSAFAKEMPSLFPRASDMKKFDRAGVWNRFNKQRNKMEPDAKKILEKINAYLQVEDLTMAPE